MVRKKEPEQFGTREEVARSLGVSRMTLYRWERVVPLTTYKGKHVWVDSNEVAVWRTKLRAEEHRRFMKRIT